MGDPLDEPRPALGLEEGARLLAAHWGLRADPGDLAELHGERDLNWEVRAGGAGHFVLKVHNPVDGPEVVDMRTGLLAHVRAVDPGLAVPEVVPTVSGGSRAAVTTADGRSCQAQLLGWLPGRHAGREELGERVLQGWGVCVARLGRAMRGYFHPAAGYPIQWDIRHAGRLRDRLPLLEGKALELCEEAIARFEARVATVLPGLRSQVVHNDMSRENVLVDDDLGIVGITDFGDATHTALVCDLAVALADVLDGRADSLEMATPMIAGYCSVAPLEAAEASLLGDLVAARAATAVVVGTWRRARHRDAPAFPTGALELLELLSAEGYPGVSARLARAALEGSRAFPPPLPYRARADAELETRRRSVLGPLGHAYSEPLHLVRGEGVELFDAAGRRYLDAYNNVPVVGHCHPAVTAAIAAQAGTLVTNTRYLHEASVELAERLLAGAPGQLDRVLLVSSGSEAVDLAWRIACHATGRAGAVVTRHAYHGITAATNDLSPEEWPEGFAPAHVALVAPPPGALGEGDARPAAADLPAAFARLKEAGHEPAALILDPAFTSDGILGPATEWMQEAASTARAAGALVVADEVQAGHGRSGTGLWSISASGVQPDLMTLGKAMGNGLPVAAVLASSEQVDPFMVETGYFSTFGGNTLACAAALAVLAVIESEDLVAHAAEVGAYLRARLDALALAHRVGPVRSFGLLAGIEIPSEADARSPDPRRARAVVDRLAAAGVLVGTTGPASSVVKIRPPLVFERRHVDELAERLDEVLGA